jgi:hypothetical protein
MIIPTLSITRQATSGTDVYGQPVLGQVYKERVAPVKLIFKTAHTTVRTDSAASKGRAYEEIDNVIFLSLPTSQIAINDVVTVLGHKVRVDSVHPRIRVNGTLDHIEVHCVGWK